MRALDTVLYIESRLIGTLSPLSSKGCSEVDCLVSLTAAGDPPFSNFLLSVWLFLSFFGLSGPCIRYDIAMPILCIMLWIILHFVALLDPSHKPWSPGEIMCILCVARLDLR